MEVLQQFSSLLLDADPAATMEVAEPEPGATTFTVNELVVHNHRYTGIVITADTNVVALAATLTDCGHDHTDGAECGCAPQPPPRPRQLVPARLAFLRGIVVVLAGPR